MKRRSDINQIEEKKSYDQKHRLQLGYISYSNSNNTIGFHKFSSAKDIENRVLTDDIQFYLHCSDQKYQLVLPYHDFKYASYERSWEKWIKNEVYVREDNKVLHNKKTQPLRPLSPYEASLRFMEPKYQSKIKPYTLKPRYQDLPNEQKDSDRMGGKKKKLTQKEINEQLSLISSSYESNKINNANTSNSSYSSTIHTPTNAQSQMAQQNSGPTHTFGATLEVTRPTSTYKRKPTPTSNSNSNNPAIQLSTNTKVHIYDDQLGYISYSKNKNEIKFKKFTTAEDIEDLVLTNDPTNFRSPGKKFYIPCGDQKYKLVLTCKAFLEAKCKKHWESWLTNKEFIIENEKILHHEVPDQLSPLSHKEASLRFVKPKYINIRKIKSYKLNLNLNLNLTRPNQDLPKSNHESFLTLEQILENPDSNENNVIQTTNQPQTTQQNDKQQNPEGGDWNYDPTLLATNRNPFLFWEEINSPTEPTTPVNDEVTLAQMLEKPDSDDDTTFYCPSYKP